MSYKHLFSLKKGCVNDISIIIPYPFLGLLANMYNFDVIRMLREVFLLDRGLLMGA
jgi:hypothetical protein